MKKTIILNLLFLLGTGILGCQQNTTETRKDIISEMYSDEQVKVGKVLRDALDAGQKRDLDRLDSYHLYGPKFTKFVFSLDNSQTFPRRTRSSRRTKL